MNLLQCYILIFEEISRTRQLIQQHQRNSQSNLTFGPSIHPESPISISNLIIHKMKKHLLKFDIKLNDSIPKYLMHEIQSNYSKNTHINSEVAKEKKKKKR